MKSGIPLPRVEGRASRQAHVDLPEGSFEREMGSDGFYGPATHFYHAHAPTGWTSFEGPLRPRAFDTRPLHKPCASPWQAASLFENARLRYRIWCGEGAMDHLARNADGDELLFVHAGAGSLYCDWGHLGFREGDYIVLPRGALWRIEAAPRAVLLLIEATGSRYRLPERGMLGEHALFDPALLAVPALDEAFAAQRSERPWRVVVRARGRLSTIEYPFNPLDAVGWKGTLVPVRLNWRDIRPVTSARYHLPPSAHTTFEADGFVVCTFCPRPLETDPGALKVPFFHSNDDYDEVIFYHQGAFFSRDEIAPGMLTLHPRGFSHGPHPAALERSRVAPAQATEEVAVMLDARDPLEVGEDAARVEWAGYVDSWKPRGAAPRA
jgi:homogentisate 1,2-dioxygenase